MTTPTLTNSGSLFNSGNGSIVVNLGTGGSISINSAAITSATPANLVNIVVTTPPSGALKLSQLLDVNTSIETDGDAVIYNQQSNTYVVTNYNLDAGQF